MGPLKHSKICGYSPLESAGAVRDAVKGEPRILMTGQGGVKIENYRKILFYSDTCIRIQNLPPGACRHRNQTDDPVL